MPTSPRAAGSRPTRRQVFSPRWSAASRNFRLFIASMSVVRSGFSRDGAGYCRPVEEWVRGRRLGIDVGTVRVGVAISDPDGILATPLVTLPRDRSTTDSDRVPSDMSAIAEFVRLHE